jgi:hypothetical protein
MLTCYVFSFVFFYFTCCLSFYYESFFNYNCVFSLIYV